MDRRSFGPIIGTAKVAWGYLHVALTGAVACPTRDIAAAYGKDRCPVCVSRVGETLREAGIRQTHFDSFGRPA